MAENRKDRSRSEGNVKFDKHYKTELTNRSIPDIAAGIPLMGDIQENMQDNKDEVRGGYPVCDYLPLVTFIAIHI